MKALPVLAIVLLAFACGKSDKGSGGSAPSTAKVESLGISVDLPAGFSLKEKNGSHWVAKSDFYAAKLEKKDAMPNSLDEAIKGWMSGTVADKGEVAGGGYFGVVEVEFPSDEGAMKLPYVYVQVPVGSGSILCSGQLQQGDDPKPLIAACSAIKPLK